MCLAIPLEVIKIINNEKILAKSAGFEIEVSTDFVKDIKLGDYVMVHAGFAIQKLNAKEAKEILSSIEGVDVV